MKTKKIYELSWPKNTVIIYYIWWAKGHGIKKNWYCAEMNGEIVDYHTKATLIANAEKKGLSWIIARYHRKGGVSIIKKSKEVSTMSKTKQSKQLKDEIFGHKEIINETLELSNDELTSEEKIDFCNAIIKYLESKKVKIENSLYEESPE